MKVSVKSLLFKHFVKVVFALFVLSVVVDTAALPLDETHLEEVRGLIELRGFHPSASKSRASRSDAATSKKDKQICFMLMPRA